MRTAADFKPYKLLIAIPTRGELKAETALALSFMIHKQTAEPLVKIGNEPRLVLWQILRRSSSNLSSLRQKFVDDAIKNDVDGLLFIDDDMIFSETLAAEWIAEDRPVIAANCPTRSVPTYPTARQESVAYPYKGDLVYSDIASLRWEKVWRVGTGIMLLRRDALKALPRPAFTQRWEPGNDDYVGEDWILCENLEKVGVPIYVDHHQSLAVRHVGEMAFTHEMVAGTRQRIVAQSGIITPSVIVPNKA